MTQRRRLAEEEKARNARVVVEAREAAVAGAKCVDSKEEEDDFQIKR